MGRIQVFSKGRGRLEMPTWFKLPPGLAASLGVYIQNSRRGPTALASVSVSYTVSTLRKYREVVHAILLFRSV